jgi:hypothetical protein
VINLNTYNTSYGRKKGWESKCQFDSQPLKVMNFPELHACRWRATYFLKPFNKSYKFFLNLTSIASLHRKLWASKVARVSISRILGLLTWKSWKKWHLGADPWPITKNTIKGKVVASPKNGLWWILCVHVCSWLIRAPKGFQLCANQLVIWFVHIYVNNWPTCHSS